MSINIAENSYLRPVTETDAKQLFEWTNEAETRKNSFSSEPVLWENHVQWLKKKVADKNCLFYIMMSGESPVGTVRLDMDDESRIGTISYSIDKQFRGMGLGGKILALLEEKAKEAGIQSLTGEVKIENKASGKCFLKNGYQLVEENPTELMYRKCLSKVPEHGKLDGDVFRKEN